MWCLTCLHFVTKRSWTQKLDKNFMSLALLMEYLYLCNASADCIQAKSISYTRNSMLTSLLKHIININTKLENKILTLNSVLFYKKFSPSIKEP